MNNNNNKICASIIMLVLITTTGYTQLSTSLTANSIEFDRANAPAYISNNGEGGSIAFTTDGDRKIKMILDRNGYRHHYAKDAEFDSWTVAYDENNNRKWILNMLDRSAGDAFRIFSEEVGEYVLTIRPSGNMELTGKLTIQGADFSEQFYVQNKKEETIQKGMVVVIQKGGKGQLEISKEPYDKKVIGIISGAGGIQTGMLMGQQETLAYGDTPIALSGRVYVWVDATKGAIEEGDFLTSSSQPGYAMKVKKYKKAQGAIIGKALTSLSKGKQGLVLVLVNLQ